jgi:hypothetical protein
MDDDEEGRTSSAFFLKENIFRRIYCAKYEDGE